MSVSSISHGHHRLISALCVVQAVLLAGIIGVGLFAVHKLGGFAYALFKLENSNDAAGWSVGRVDTFDMIDGVDRTAVVFLGDSITHQAEWSELLHAPSVRNRGVDGDSTDQVLHRLGQVTKIQPAKIFLMIGVNDLVVRTPDAVFSNIQKIVQGISDRSPETRVILQSVIPLNNAVKERHRSNDDIRALNGLIKGYALDRHMPYIDVYSALVDDRGDLDRSYTRDGIHLTGPGYGRWIDLLRSSNEVGS